ncbi:MAG: NmrA family NAD(P)-binding protein [Planctomycetia bacterium]|nr:NmrA family NAD(P)-binding protein [Planctomycetia bacterium]
MDRPKILIHLDTDPQPSVFDAVVAVDAGVDHLLRHAGVGPEAVLDLVHGAMFTRGPEDLKHTAIFIGGSDVAAGERLLSAVEASFFGPVRVSVMIDSNGSNTTAVAAVLAAGGHLPLAGCQALVLAATGPVGSRVVRLLAREGAEVRVGSRTLARSEATCAAVAAQVEGAKLQPLEINTREQLAAALDGVQLLIAAGAAGKELVPAEALAAAPDLSVAIDLNAVPPAGIAGIKVTDRAKDRDGVTTYGAIGVGGSKMKIHKAAVRRLFTSHELMLDAEEIYHLGRQLSESHLNE